MNDSKTLADFMGTQIRLSDNIFEDNEGRRYRPLKLDLDRLIPKVEVAILDRRYVKTTSFPLHEALNHKHIRPYSRLILVG